MIKLQDLTPDVYYKQSRDFQYIGRLFDVVLNSIKTNTDLIYNCPFSTKSDSKLLDLTATTLGFKAKHKYNAEQLKAVCSVFNEVLKYKGSIKALEIAFNAILRTTNTDQQFEYKYEADKHNIIIYIPEDTVDLVLFNDLLDYILPAGVTVSFIKTLIYRASASTEIGLSSNAEVVAYRETPDNARFVRPNPDDPDSDKHLDSALTTTGTGDNKQPIIGQYMNDMIYRPERTSDEEDKK